MPNHQITWLHLSDWHQDVESIDREILLEPLINDIRNRSEIDPSLENIDFLFFNGDLVDTGKEHEFDLAHSDFLLPVFKSVDFPKDPTNRFFIVPGNHDLDREELELMEKNLSENELLDYISADKKRKRLLVPFENYENALMKIFKESNNSATKLAYGTSYHFQHKGIKISVVGLNTAWRSARNRGPDGKVNDYGFLTVGEHQIQHSIKSPDFKEADLSICVMHHPSKWLGIYDQTYIQNVLEAKFDFVLTGHQHEPSIKIQISSNGNCVYIPAGASYAGRFPDHPNRTNAYNYFYLDIDTHEGKIFFRKWSEKRREWIEDSDTHENGSFSHIFPLHKNRNITAFPVSYPKNKDISHHVIDNTKNNYRKLLDQLSKVEARLHILQDSTNDPAEKTSIHHELQACQSAYKYYSDLLHSMSDSHPDIDIYIRSKNLEARNILIGRNHQLIYLLQHLEPGNYTKMIILKGPSGVGKTSLAVELCYQALEKRFVDHVIFMSAQPSYLETDNVAEVDVKYGNLDAILKEIETINGPDSERELLLRTDKVRRILASKRILLVADNFEEVSDQEVLNFLKYSVPLPSKVILTTRDFLPNMTGLVEDVERLQYPDAAILIRLSSLEKNLDNIFCSSPSMLHRIFHWSSGLPLAILWLLGLLRDTSVDAEVVMKEIESGDFEEEELLLSYLFERNFEKLAPDGKNLIYCLSVFSSFATFETLQQILNSSTSEIIKAIAAAYQKSLVQKDENKNSYFLLPIVRRFLSKSKDAQTKIQLYYDKAYNFYFEKFESVEEITGSPAEFINHIDSEKENIFGIIDWAIQRNRWEDVLRIGFKVNYIIGSLGFYKQRLEYAQKMLFAADQLGDTKRKAEVLIKEIGWIMQHTGDSHEAYELIKDGINLAKNSQDHELEAIGLRNLGLLLFRQAQISETSEKEKLLGEAQGYCEIALRISISNKYPRWAGISLRTLALISLARENKEDALRLYEEAIEYHKKSNDLESLALTLSDIGKINHLLGDDKIAKEFFIEALELDDKYGRKYGMAKNRERLAILELSSGNIKEAIELLQKAIEIFEDMGAIKALQKTKMKLEAVREGKIVEM